MKKEIIICFGSFCFTVENKLTVQIIKQYIKVRQLEDMVYFHGSHCFGNCENGPVIKVDDKEYQHVSPENIIYLLDKIFSAD